MLKTCPALYYTQMTGLSDSMKDTSSVSFLLHYAGCKNNDCFLIKKLCGESGLLSLNLLASTPHLGILGLTVEKDVPNVYDRCWLQCATYTICVSLQRRAFELYYSSYRGDNAQNIKSYRLKCLVKSVPHWMKKMYNCISYKKIHERSPGKECVKSRMSCEIIIQILRRYHEKWLYILRLYITPPILHKPGMYCFCIMDVLMLQLTQI